MKIITTRYQPATLGRGARIVARGPQSRASIPYPHDLSITERHRAACRKLAARLKWSGTVHEGISDDGGGHIFMFVGPTADTDTFVI